MTEHVPTFSARDDEWGDDPGATVAQWTLGVVAPMALAVYRVLAIAHSVHVALATGALGAAVGLHCQFFVGALMVHKLPARVGTVVGCAVAVAAVGYLVLR